MAHCNKCGTNTETTKRVTVETAPEVLILFFKRTKYDLDKDTATKISTEVGGAGVWDQILVVPPLHGSLT